MEAVPAGDQDGVQDPPLPHEGPHCSSERVRVGWHVHQRELGGGLLGGGGGGGGRPAQGDQVARGLVAPTPRPHLAAAAAPSEEDLGPHRGHPRKPRHLLQGRPVLVRLRVHEGVPHRNPRRGNVDVSRLLLALGSASISISVVIIAVAGKVPAAGVPVGLLPQVREPVPCRTAPSVPSPAAPAVPILGGSGSRRRRHHPDRLGRA